MSTISDNALKIKKLAIDAGFDECGISPVMILQKDGDFLSSWIKNKHYAGLDFLTESIDKRIDTRKYCENAKSVVSLLLNYNTSAKQSDAEAPIVAKYALHDDYHAVIKSLLQKLLVRINSEVVPASGIACVDTSPVFERAYAKKSGLGWIGKNMCLINKKHGSFVFIGELLLDIELEYDSEIENLCGDCTKCIDACPTGALTDQHYIDANKCLSYLTIQHKGPFPDSLSGSLSNRIYGCDICQDVCPWNKRAGYSKPNHLTINEALLNMTLSDWKKLDKEKFNRIFKDSSIKRIGYEKLKNLFCIIEEQNKKVKG